MATPTKLNGTAITWTGLTFTGGGTVVVTHVVLKSGGVLKFVAPLTASRTMYSGDSANFAIGTLAFTALGTGGAVVGNALALALLDAMLGSTTLGPASYDVGLYSAAPLADGTGGTEFPATGNYATIAKTNNATNFPAASLV